MIPQRAVHLLQSSSSNDLPNPWRRLTSITQFSAQITLIPRSFLIRLLNYWLLHPLYPVNAFLDQPKPFESPFFAESLENVSRGSFEHTFFDFRRKYSLPLMKTERSAIKWGCFSQKVTKWVWKGKTCYFNPLAPTALVLQISKAAKGLNFHFLCYLIHFAPESVIKQNKKSK